MPRNRRRDEEQEVELEDDVEMEVGTDEEMENNRQQTLEEELAVKFVRYALSCEYSRTPIKRQGIRDRVLGDHPRAFKKVFKQAQKILKEVYALEMQELPMREKLTIEEKRKAMQSQTGGNKTSETWIVVNVLPQEYRDPVILPPSSSPTAEKEATKIGFYTLIICLIAITGGEVTEQQLFRHLGRMNADKMLGDQRTEDVLQTLEKQGYIVKKTEQISAAEDKSVTYLVGPRGKTEVGNQGVANVVRMVWGGSTPELERKIAVSLGLEEPTEDEVQESQEREAEEEEEPEAEERSTRRSSGRRSTRRHVVDDDDEN